MTTAIFKYIKDNILNNIDLKIDPSDEQILEKINSIASDIPQNTYASINEKSEIIASVFNSLRRFDILQPLIDDKEITEIMVNGPDKIFFEKNGQIFKTDLKFDSIEVLQNIIQTMVYRVNRIVNEAFPIVDARLEDGSRISIVLTPIALNGPIITIRKFPEHPINIKQLIDYEALTENAADVLNKLIKSKYNILISGGTSSGKTSLLNALSCFISSDERIITIEDSAELKIKGVSNIVRLETRNPNTEGKGEVTVRDLIRASLRMRPDRIIIGEVRGVEAIDMLQAMNTGHDGCISTIHANSTDDVLVRLETMVLSGTSIPLEAIRRQIASAVDIVIHLGKLRDKSRRILEISETSGYENGVITFNKLFEFVESPTSSNNIIKGCLVRTSNPMINTQKLKSFGIGNKI